MGNKRDKAIFEMRKGRYVAAIGFVAKPRVQDWQCFVFRDGAEPFQITYRFRYYRDDKAFDSADERSAYHAQAQASDSEERIVAAMKNVAAMLMEHGFGSFQDWLYPRSADANVTFAMLKSRSWAHVREEPE